MRALFSKKKIISDEALIEQYKITDDINVLSNLYIRYMDLVFGVCLKYLNNKEDAQDATMQIFEKLINAVKTNTIESFRPWLYVVAKNFCLMEIRQKKSIDKNIDISEKKSFVFMESDFELHPLDTNNSEKEEALKNCIEKLNDTQKRTVELFYFKKLTYDQISISMNIEVKKVKSYLQNAKRNLKICIEKSYAE